MSDAPRPVVVPRLTTDRLLLRELRTSDFDAYAAFLADPIATRYVGSTVDRRSAWRLFASLSGVWMLTGAGWWAVELRSTGAFLGTVGAFFRETTLWRGPEADLELGWSILPSFWRQGYAREAARAAMEFGFDTHSVKRAVAHVDLANEASVNVSKAIGMSFDGEVDFYEVKLARYAIDRGAVAAQRSSERPGDPTRV